MKKLWSYINKKIKNRKNAFYTFLFVHTFSWTIPPLLIVLAGCVLLKIQMLRALSAALTVSGLTGVFIGFLGGLLFLLSTQEALTTDEF